MKKILFVKIIFILVLLIWCFIKRQILPLNQKLKVCLCTPVKKENLYIKEFIEHYKSYNVDKIFLYDNNDINGEHL